MHRRDLLRAGAAVAAAASVPLPSLSHSRGAEPAPGLYATPPLPRRIAGMTLPQLRDDYRDRLFNQYLPFWEKGGIDQKFGGVLCELNDDGSAAEDLKYIWYQGRGIWVYSFLYNEFGKDRRWLEVARQTRDFMVKYMYAGEGKWNENVRRDGSLLEGVGETVYGWLFAALGLAEYHRATGEKADFDLAKQSLLAAMKAYDDPKYADTHTMLYSGLDIDPHGLRSQGHSMVALRPVRPVGRRRSAIGGASRTALRPDCQAVLESRVPHR